ncbi:MAG: Gfo/Idh/MocA family protein, partial [Terriglobales bacterium]
MPSAFKVAIVGAGFMGEAHAGRWMRHEDAELIGVFDLDREAASKIKAPYFKTWEELVKAGPDIVDICTPTTTHLELIRKAAAANKAVMCEKPLARTLEQCDQCIDVIRRSGIPLMAAHVLRYFPEYETARRLVQ